MASIFPVINYRRSRAQYNFRVSIEDLFSLNETNCNLKSKFILRVSGPRIPVQLFRFGLVSYGWFTNHNPKESLSWARNLEYITQT